MPMHAMQHSNDRRQDMEQKLAPTVDIDAVMERAADAAAAWQEIDQEQTDRIVHAAYQAGFNNRVRLAEMACQETRMGVVRDKVMKNIIATRFVYQDIKNLKTVGVISSDPLNEVVEIAKPIGPIFAVTPVTNPTSTVMFKILISLKSRNPLIIRPHGAAKKCSIEAARILTEAALAAGAPEHCVQWIKRSTEEETLQFMAHRRTALILATGSVSLVRAAYSSGNPAIGIGPGNVPVYIGRTADFEYAVDAIVASKTFDNGTICASEQAVVVKEENTELIRGLFHRKKAHFLTPEEIGRVETIAYNQTQRVMNPAVIGQSAHAVAKMAGVSVPEDTTVLIAELKEVGRQSPLSLEILCPILAFYTAPDFDSAITICRKINRYGGLGHTASIFSRHEERIEYFANAMNAGRILVNTPASFGALGGTYNTLQPSMTLACGSGGKNITTDNISAKHLLNIQRIARRKMNNCFECVDHFSMDQTVDALTIDNGCWSLNNQNGDCKNRFKQMAAEKTT